MSLRVEEALNRLAGPIYCVGALFVATPIFDFVMNVWPPAPGMAEWRYGAIGLFAGFTLSPLLGSALIVWVALVRGDRRTQTLMAILNLAAAVLLLPLCVDFILDVVQLRSHIADRPDARWSYYGGAAKSLIKYLTIMAALAWLGRTGWRSRPTQSMDPIVVRRS
ncbi:MAG TPA: hypothetical protein VJN62_05825 [Gemmatimonadales bacterium]|nr:hypothetical protein [Gemmatimonadales bacterium]